MNVSWKERAGPFVKIIFNRMFIALAGVSSGVLFAAFPLQMAQICGLN